MNWEFQLNEFKYRPPSLTGHGASLNNETIIQTRSRSNFLHDETTYTGNRRRHSASYRSNRHVDRYLSLPLD